MNTPCKFCVNENTRKPVIHRSGTICPHTIKLNKPISKETLNLDYQNGSGVVYTPQRTSKLESYLQKNGVETFNTTATHKATQWLDNTTAGKVTKGVTAATVGVPLAITGSAVFIPAVFAGALISGGKSAYKKRLADEAGQDSASYWDLREPSLV